MDYIRNYIAGWGNTTGVKPANDGEFIDHFLGLMENSDYDHWKFDGENGYCGYTATLYEHPQYLPVYGLEFEFAYGHDFVKVFDARHGGFWVPEYIDLKGLDAEHILLVLKKKLIGWAGLHVGGNNG